MYLSKAYSTFRSTASSIRGHAKRLAAPERIYLVSVAGCPNYGDEYIARSWLHFLAKHKPRAEVWLDCPDPGRAASILHGLHPNFHTTGTLWELTRQTSGTDARTIGDYVRERVVSFGSPAVDLGLEILRGSNILHAIGGGYINDLWPTHVGVLAGLAEAKKITKARLYSTGIGFVPLCKSNCAYVRELLGDFDYIEARDSVSADMLGINGGCDDAFLGLNWSRSRTGQGTSPRLMVLLQGDFLDQAQAPWALDAIRQFIHDNLGNTNGDGVGFVEAIPPTDARFYLELAAEYPKSRFYPFGHIWNHGIPFHPSQLWLTSRFHMHLLAAAHGCAGIAISIDPDYYDVKHHSLTALGTGWNIISPQDEAPLIRLPKPSGNKDFASKSKTLAREKLKLARSLYRR